jgi:biotin--protein ligase
MNVLIYNGNGTSPTSVKQTYTTLKSILGHAYDVMKVDATTLKSEPWEETCSLLVIPGGRDQPYCEDLNGAGNKKIAQYVQNGGHYLGLCAGAYYASSEIEFGKGSDMEIIGKRELGFFKGTCRGTMFPGFVYNSEKGAKSVSIVTNSQKKIKTYYNGGGYFVNANQVDDVKVICTYEEAGLSEEATPAAAGIQCQVGKGSALLFGVHPEYNVELVDLSENTEKEIIIQELTASFPFCHDLLSTSLSELGLNVLQQFTATITNEVPSLTPMYLSAINTNTLDAIKSKLSSEVNDQSILNDSNDSFYISEIQSNQEKEIEDMLNKLSIESGKEGKLPVLQILYPQGNNVPEKELTPLFDIKEYYESLLSRRKLEWGGGSWYRFGNAMLYSEVITSTQTVLDK